MFLCTQRNLVIHIPVDMINLSISHYHILFALVTFFVSNKQIEKCEEKIRPVRFIEHQHCVYITER